MVHTDDLAVSAGIPTPEFPDDAFAPVRDLLVRLAVRRHGQAAVIGTLTRRERSRVISAFQDQPRRTAQERDEPRGLQGFTAREGS